jgi:hypothetical protein
MMHLYSVYYIDVCLGVKYNYVFCVLWYRCSVYVWYASEGVAAYVTGASLYEKKHPLSYTSVPIWLWLILNLWIWHCIQIFMPTQLITLLTVTSRRYAYFLCLNVNFFFIAQKFLSERDPSVLSPLYWPKSGCSV